MIGQLQLHQVHLQLVVAEHSHHHQDHLQCQYNRNYCPSQGHPIEESGHKEKFYFQILVDMRLQTKRRFCSCGGVICLYKDRVSHVSIYTETGPIMIEHLESRCKDCNKGYFYGYTSDSTMEDQLNTVNSKKHCKLYEEDCLEAEVNNYLF